MGELSCRLSLIVCRLLSTATDTFHLTTDSKEIWNQNFQRAAFKTSDWALVSHGAVAGCRAEQPRELAAKIGPPHHPLAPSKSFFVRTQLHDINRDPAGSVPLQIRKVYCLD